MPKPGNKKVKEGQYETSADCPRFIPLLDGYIILRHPTTGKNVRMSHEEAEAFVNDFCSSSDDGGLKYRVRKDFAEISS
jgi:hypothetical protein